MLRSSTSRIAALLLSGSLLTVACGEEGDGDDGFVNPITQIDASVTIPADTGVPAPSPMGSTGGAGQDAGGTPVPTMDASTPQPTPTEAGSPEAGAGGADAGMSGAGDGGDAASPSADGGAGGDTTCCPDGNCLCHGSAPSALTSDRGPFRTMSYTVAGAGCVYYPVDAQPPFAAVAVSDGFLGTGGCGRAQTGDWGPLYASWGIVTMVVNTGSGDQPSQRGAALTRGITAFKSENTKSGSPLMGKLSGRYGTSGFSMGGGGTSFAAEDDRTLKSSIMIMPYGPTRGTVTVPTLVICGSSDGTAPCSSHGTPFYGRLAENVPKMRVTVQDGHRGQPSAGSGMSGKVGLAFQKVFLEGDTRWRPLLVGAMSNATNIR